MNSFLSASHFAPVKRKTTPEPRDRERLPFIDKKLFFDKVSKLIKSQGFFLNIHDELFHRFRIFSKDVNNPLLDSHVFSVFSLCKVAVENSTPQRPTHERLPYINKRLFFRKSSSLVKQQGFFLVPNRELFQRFRIYSRSCTDPLAGDNLSSFLSIFSICKVSESDNTDGLPNKLRAFQALEKHSDKGDTVIDDLLVEKFRLHASKLGSNRFFSY